MSVSIKRVLLIFSAAAVIFCLGSLRVSAEVVSNGTCGDNLTWELSDDGVLTISGTGEMEDFKSAPWADEDTDITAVVIEEGVTSIGANAFEHEVYMTDISISNTVTSIGLSAFYSCDGLTQIVIPDSVVSISDGAFIFCSNLQSVTFGEGLSTIDDSAFKSCWSLEEIVIPESVTSIGSNAFNGCSALKSVVINGKVSAIEYQTFSSCASLTTVTIPGSVTEVARNAFWGDVSLTDVYFGGTQAQWKSIVFRENNEYLLNAQIHYGTQTDGSAVQTEEGGESEAAVDSDGQSDAAQAGASGSEGTGVIPIFLIAVLICVLAGLLIIIRSNRRKPAEHAKTNKQSSGPAEQIKAIKQNNDSAGSMKANHQAGEFSQPQVRFCPNCGVERAPGARFCHSCGKEYPHSGRKSSS